MKKIILLVGGFLCFVVSAFDLVQTTEGLITYEVKINVHRNIAPENEQMKEMVPEFRVHRDKLAFNENESFFSLVEEENTDEDLDNGQGMHIRMQRPRNEIYVNRENFRRVMLQEFMGKKFLIEDTLKVAAWKLGTETREIRGYLCKQATFFNEERKQNITVWYTDALRPFLGPENFNTLPGTVLQVDINDGERVITAQQIELRPLKKGEIKIPSGGTKTSEKEFRSMVAEHVKRMKANGANVIIRN